MRAALKTRAVTQPFRVHLLVTNTLFIAQYKSSKSWIQYIGKASSPLEVLHLFCPEFVICVTLLLKVVLNPFMFNTLNTIKSTFPNKLFVKILTPVVAVYNFQCCRSLLIQCYFPELPVFTRKSSQWTLQPLSSLLA